MNAEEKDNGVQQLMTIRNKVRELERNFKETLEMIEEYKNIMINVQIDALEVKKKERWFEKWT